MFCAKCGKQNVDGNKFCAGCGAPLDASGAQPQQAQPQQTNYFSGGNGGNASSGGGKVGPLDFSEFKMDGLLNNAIENAKNIKGLKLPNFLMMGGGLVFFISIFLPYLTTDFVISLSVNFASSGAFHVILAILFSLFAIFVGCANKTTPMVVTGGVLLLFDIIEALVNTRSDLSDYYSHGIGFWFMLIAAIAACAGGVMKLLGDMKK